MTIDCVDYHRHLEERLAQLGHEFPGPTLAPRLSLRDSARVGGGPGSIYAAHALDAVEQFLPEPEVSLAGA